MGSIEKLRLRNSYPIDETDPDSPKVRALRLHEVSAIEGMTPEQKTGYIVGCGLLDDDGGQFFKSDGMGPADFANHVLSTAEISMDWLHTIVETINRVSNPQKPEAIAKN